MFQASNRALVLLQPWTQWAAAVVLTDDDTAPAPHATLHIDLAAGVGMDGLVHAALVRRDDPRARLLVDDRTNFTANILRRVQFREVADLLESAKLDWTLIKGAAVLEYEPAWRATRRMTDIDLLVDFDRMDEVHELLQSHGFNRVDATGWCSRRWIAASTWHKQGLTLLELDVHGRLHHWPLLAGVEAAVMASRSAPDGLNVPGLAESLVVIALHRARSGYRNSATELVDAALLARRMQASEWESVAMLCRAHALHVPLFALFGACREWLGINFFPLTASLWDGFPEELQFRAERMARGLWQAEDDLSWLVPMAKLYRPFLDPPGAAWTGRMGRAFVWRNASALTALGLHAITRSLDQIPLDAVPVLARR
jgi:hypothetical protein